MKRGVWKTFSTLFTVAGTAALIGGLVLWRTGRLRLEIGAGGTAEAAAAPATPPPEEKTEPPPPPELDEPASRTWYFRLKAEREQLTAVEKSVEDARSAFARDQAVQETVKQALVELLAHLVPESDVKDAAAPVSAEEKLKKRRAEIEAALVDATAAENLRGRLLGLTAREKRVPELLATVAEMNAEEAASLLGKGVDLELAAEILRRMEAEERASILEKLVRSDPDRAGAIFTQLAGEKEEG